MDAEVRAVLIALQREANERSYGLELPSKIRGKEKIFNQIYAKLTPGVERGRKAAAKRSTRAFSKLERSQAATSMTEPVLVPVLTNLVDMAIAQISTDVSPIFVGTLPDFRVSAILRTFEDPRRHLLAVTSGFFSFFHTAASCLSVVADIDDGENQFLTVERLQEKAINALKQREFLVKAFQQNILHRVERRQAFMNDDGRADLIILHHPTRPPPTTIEYPRSLLASMLREGMELFAVGHEFYHVLQAEQRDLDEASTARLKQAGLPDWQISYSEEHAADAIGARLCVLAMNKIGFPASGVLIAIDTFFLLMDLLDQATHLLLEGFRPPRIEPDLSLPKPPNGFSPTHPPMYLRRAMFHRGLGEFLGGLGMPALEKRALKRARIMEAVIEWLFEPCVHTLKAYHDENVTTLRDMRRKEAHENDPNVQ